MSVRCVGTPAVGQSADGRLELFVRGLSDQGGDLGSLYHRWQRTPGGDWSNWYSHGGSFLGDPVVARNTEGRLELFIVAEDGLAQKWQTAPSNAWSDWHFAGRAATLPFNPYLAIAPNADGRLEVFALAWDGHGRVGVYHLWQLEPSRGWSAVTLLDLLPVSVSEPLFPVVAPNTDGRLELFVIAEGTVYHKWQTAANTIEAWSGWHSHGAITVVLGRPTVSPAIATNSDGRLELFVVAPNGDGTGASLQHIWQLIPSGGWSDRDVSAWRTEPGEFLDPYSGPTAARHADARLELFAVGAVGTGDGVMWHKTQISPNNGWSDWSLLSDSQNVRFDGTGNHPRLVANADGSLVAFAIGREGALWYARQMPPNGSWSNWVPLGRPIWISTEDFPIAWYDEVSALPGKPQVMANEGVNLILACYHGYSKLSDVTTFLDAVRAAGLRALIEIATLGIDNGQVPPTFIQGGKQGLIDYIRAFRDRPEVLGWYLFDEPDAGSLPPDRARSAYQTIKAEDTTRLIAGAFSGDDRPDQGKPEQYLDAMDVCMVDFYPRFGAVEFDGLDGYFLKMSSYVARAGGKTYWAILPGKQVWGNSRIPTFAEQRYFVYAAAQAGASGLFFWQHYESPQLWIDSILAPVIWDFGHYASGFARGALPGKASASNASTTATVYPDPDQHGFLLLLIHHDSGTVTTTVTIDAFLHVTTVNVPDENARSLRFGNGTFTDSLGPYEVRLYALR